MNTVDVILGLLCAVAPAAWAFGDAQRRGQSGGIVVLLFVLFGPLAAIVWLIIRPRTTIVDRVPEDYGNADKALAAAARLDQMGEWDAAISLYENTARRWPEHENYISNCLTRIKKKMSPA